jgi:predicted N-acetyltransferase YhbS
MNSSPVIRPAATGGERAAFFRLAAEQFIRDTPPEIAAADFQRYVREALRADATAMRGAFRGGDYLGGYLIEERWLRIGAARVRAGCIGVVVIDRAYRGQGIGKALMRGSFAYARERGMALLLLHGLAGFYRPFSYADVFDPTEHSVRQRDVLDAAPSPYRVRPATAADAAALLDLYDRHYGPHPGSFARGLEQQDLLLCFAASLDRGVYRQREGTAFLPPVVAVDGEGQVRGYRVEPWGPLRAFGSEVAADDWPATLALLQHHARQLGELAEPPEMVRWPLPPDALAAALIADHFIVERTSLSRPSANWEAAVVDPVALLRAMVPAWEERWRLQATNLPGALAFTLDGVTCQLDLSPGGVTLGAPRGDEAITVAFTGATFLPLIFGFRGVAWAAAQKGQALPPEALPLLEVLFPPLMPWIAPSDGC